jgi:hypothetical protein
MEAYEDSFKEFVILKGYARQTGIAITVLRRFKDKNFRGHLMTLHGNGSPLSEIIEYIDAFYGITITPQQLRKILQKAGGDAWKTAVADYTQYRVVRAQEKALLALGN